MAFCLMKINVYLVRNFGSELDKTKFFNMNSTILNVTEKL